jgi:uncharacterized protein
MIDRIKNKFKETHETFLNIKARTGAVKTKFADVLSDGTIKVDIAKQPEKGRANGELIAFLAREFDVSRKSVKIISGASSKSKLIKISK